MLPRGLLYRYLNRLSAPADAAERLRVERVLASARVFLTTAAVVAIYVDATEPTRYEELAYVLLLGYAAYSLAIWLLLQLREDFVRQVFWIHVMDVIFPAVFTLFTQGPSSPFFLFFTFTVTSAAFRWGLPETFATSFGIALLMTGEAALFSFGGPRWHTLVQGEFELNRFIIRSSYLILIGTLLGFLSEEEKQVRAENAVISRVIGRARVENGMRGTLQGLLGEVMQVFAGRRAIAIFEQAGSGRVFLWQASRMANSDQCSIDYSEPSPAEARGYLFSMPGQVFCVEQDGEEWNCLALGADGTKLRIVPDAWETPYVIGEVTALLAVELALGEEWSGRLLVVDPHLGAEKAKEMRFALRLVRQTGPAVYTVYLLRRLRSRAGALERARVARELHDGAIQSLIAVEMQVDVLRRQAESARSAAFSEPLRRIQDWLQDLVVDLRSLMQQMRPVELKRGQLLDFLAAMVDRFRRDSGITATFACDLEEADLPPRMAREVVRMVQEALVNVRKHSGAHTVVVRFSAREGNWTVGVEDDGRGFDFVGRMSLADLGALHKGPGVLMERVRSVGGDLTIQSLPGRGSNLEITVPQKQVTYV